MGFDKLGKKDNISFGFEKELKDPPDRFYLSFPLTKFVAHYNSLVDNNLAPILLLLHAGTIQMSGGYEDFWNDCGPVCAFAIGECDNI